ncbi:hypothetical protein DET49_10336 [Salegentibacter sp. 24]|nr:hypothetical protein DET49_10336 [Salegentibacter sp. 24]
MVWEAVVNTFCAVDPYHSNEEFNLLSSQVYNPQEFRAVKLENYILKFADKKSIQSLASFFTSQ